LPDASIDGASRPTLKQRFIAAVMNGELDQPVHPVEFSREIFWLTYRKAITPGCIYLRERTGEEYYEIH